MTVTLEQTPMYSEQDTPLFDLDDTKIVVRCTHTELRRFGSFSCIMDEHDGGHFMVRDA